MASHSVSVEETTSILRRRLLGRDVLLSHCPLDYGRHELSPAASLGKLGQLPVELLHQVLRDIDLRSLVAFRQANQRAMQVVDGMLEWEKVLHNAPDTIRMAIGIKTASNFTLSELCSKLCQKHCDYCDELAPYMDMFMLNRRCGLGTPSTRCAGPSWAAIPHSLIHPKAPPKMIYEETFVSVPGHHATAHAFPRILYRKCHKEFANVIYNTLNYLKHEGSLEARPSDLAFYRGRMCHPQLVSLIYKTLSDQKGSPEAERAFYLGRRCSLVVAPWLSATSKSVKFAYSCRACIDRKSPFGFNHSEALKLARDITVYTEERTLAQHIEEHHPDEKDQ